MMAACTREVAVAVRRNSRILAHFLRRRPKMYLNEECKINSYQIVPGVLASATMLMFFCEGQQKLKYENLTGKIVKYSKFER